MTTYDLLIPTFQQMLKALSAQLAKAATFAADTGLDANALPGARLAADMFPLAAQVRLSCHQANNAVALLSGTPVPPIPECSDDIPALQACIADTLAKLADADRSAIDGPDDRMIAFGVPNGMTFHLTAAQFVRDWAIPQLYFHLMAAYAILRVQGVPLGKADFVGHMFAYIAAPA